MLRLVISLCLLGAVGLVIVGGCTPEANKTWSESDDWLYDWSGVYSVNSSLDDRFTSMTLYQTGNKLQGFDNMRRSWFGSISGNSAYPNVNLETSDGPSGTEVILGTADLDDVIRGQHWCSPRTGTIQMALQGWGGDGGEEEE